MRLPAARFVGPNLTTEFLAAIRPVDPERVIVASAPVLMRRLWGRDTRAMTIGRKVFVDPRAVESGGAALAELLRHELVHVRQWGELGAGPFLASYLRQYLVGRASGRSHREAYRSIGFEAEAREVARIGAP